MKFGEYLETNKNPAWADSYLDYNKPKKMISALEQQLISRQAFTGAPAARMFDEAREHGLGNGASFAIHGRRGEMAMLSLARPGAEQAARQDTLHFLGTAQGRRIQHVGTGFGVGLQAADGVGRGGGE